MSGRIFVILGAALLLVVVPRTTAAAPPLVELRGHGIWALDQGDVYDNHQQYLESTAINAWLDEDGTAHGTIVWMDVLNGPYEGAGPSFSGYTWQIDVDTLLVLADDLVYLEGFVTHSNYSGDG